MSNISELIDNFSEDLGFLLDARRALITHPLKGLYAAEELFNAPFCRLFIGWAVEAIEIMLQIWQERDRIAILNQYFDEGTSNEDRVNALCSAFRQAGIDVDPEVFKDFLAIKFLRNAIVHGRSKDDEKEWLDSRGFPIDVQTLTNEHLDRVYDVYQEMAFYIFLTWRRAPHAAKLKAVFKSKKTATQISDEPGILRADDINRIIWQNLERICYYIHQDIEQVVCSEKYYWAKGLSDEDLDQMEHRERKRLFYLAAWRAGKADHPLLVQHRPLAKEALAFWHEYWQRVIVPGGLDEKQINQALQVLTSPHFSPELPEWSCSGFLSDEAFAEFLDAAWPELEETMPWSKQEVTQALLVGKLAYKLLPNTTPLTLLSVHLPIVDPANVDTYCQEAKRALSVLKLCGTWYFCVEHHERFTGEDLDWYVRLCEEFVDTR